MPKTDWDIQKIKRLKWILFIQLNIVMILLFIPLIYYVMAGVSASLFLRLFCLLLWIIVAHTFYTFRTGKLIGTKTIKLVFAFDRDCLGERRWKRNKMIELIILIFFSIVFTILVFMIDFNDRNLDTYSLFPFIGSWVGTSIGQILKLNKLK